jgi:hypothetical protein
MSWHAPSTFLGLDFLISAATRSERRDLGTERCQHLSKVTDMPGEGRA